MGRSRACVLATIAAAACTGAPTRDDAPPPGADVTVVVDGREVAALRGAELAAPSERWLPAGSPPPSTWTSLEVDGVGPRLAIPRFGERMADARLVLAWTARGARLEIVPRVADDLPPEVRAIAAAPIASAEGVRRIEIRTRAAAASAPTTLAIRVGDAPARTVEASDLDRLRPHGRGEARGPVPLRALVGLVAGLDEVAAVALVAADGETVTVDAAALAGDDVLTLRRNRRGGLRYERFAARGAERTDTLRDVERVEVRLRTAAP